ncbi:hypothetical protein KSS87_003584, partial [Heliosperma pusillum]
MKEDSSFTQGVTMQTICDKERKTHCSQKELQCKLWVMKEDSFSTQGVTMQTMGKWVMKEVSLFTQGVAMQTMGNEETKTHCSHKELQCKQWV